MIWNIQKNDGMMIYKANDEYNEYVIRSWPYDESDEGKFQLCVDGFHKGNFKTLKSAKEFIEWYY